ncbi:hypothetical protein F4678DRAFT_74593 [Xylaria arbuscula]|nr:hypothetical protein F4678DRAFT_74593 [Xylaria arbuscula]
METINNIASSAAKAVWGENKPSTDEPVSGRYGDTSKGEPYDAGNLEPISGNTGEAAPSNVASSNVASSDGTVDRNDTAERRVDSETREDAKFAKTTGTATESNDTPDNPTAELKAESGPSDSTKGQNDTRSPEDPKTNPKSAPTDVNDAPEEGVNEAQKPEGPGPKPVAEIAKANGGDAGNDRSSSEGKTSQDEQSKDVEEDKHESEGTGEQYVKSSGLQADGGDFDATNPGAGREADRLMEEKGIHPTGDESGGPAEDGGSPTSGKKSFGQKIKDKLHRH